MATSEIEIIPTPPTSIELEPGQEEKRSFTVESLAAQCRILEIRGWHSPTRHRM